MHRVTIACLALFLTARVSSAQSGDPAEFFEKKIRPVLANNCQGCHNTKLKTAGLDLSTAEGFARGGAGGPLVAGDAEKSLLLRVVSYDDRLKMPPMKKLAAEQLADLTAWVKAGAVWPGASPTAPVRTAKGGREITAADRQFWAFQPVHDQAVPAVKNQSWVRSPIDAFLLAKLEAKGLQPAPPADKVTLLRRATYDLTGLPPTEEDLRAFLADSSPQAFEKVVDRLLASPRYGEQWGRHWLDVARYADSTGNDEDHRYPYAWRYRDYVIDAFNQDLPYDQFVREQIAGDLLPGVHPGQVNRRGVIATGFLALGAKAIAQQDKKKMLYDVYDEQIEVVSKGVLGLTVQCARCHDHKFDPILTRDYYSLVSIFASTRNFKDSEAHVSKLLYTPLAPKDVYARYEQHQQKLNRKNTDIEDLVDSQLEEYTRKLTPRLADYMIAARAVYADKRDAAEVARERGLQEDVLQKWVKYLTPTPEGKAHLDEWRNASTSQLSTAARAYQTRFEARLEEWSKTLNKWRAQYRKMTEEGNMPPPERPKFAEDQDRFFYEVYFDGPLSVAKKDQEKVLSAEAREQLATWRKEAKELKDSMPPEPDMACAVEEGPAVEQKVLLRGDYNNLGPDAPKAFPTVLVNGEQPRVAKGSGRLELAEWLTRPDHPLTARVMVNRIWQWHFGEALVRTPDNFGKMGERPTHPELLDFLARQFVEKGWSVKQMHRLLMLSSAYQMSSQISDAANQHDPENRLWSRFPRRRLTVEEIRDGLLAIDGSLDVTMGGTLQSGFGTDQENSNDRLSLKPETIRRRMVYLPLRRANLPTLLNLYDFGDATTASGKRALTTVAPQALFMMNSDFIAERARHLAEAVLQQSPDEKTRVERLFVKVLNRQPDPQEIDAALTYVTSFQQKFAGQRTPLDSWMSYSRILLGSNEFIYLE